MLKSVLFIKTLFYCLYSTLVFLHENLSDYFFKYLSFAYNDGNLYLRYVKVCVVYKICLFLIFLVLWKSLYKIYAKVWSSKGVGTVRPAGQIRWFYWISLFTCSTMHSAAVLKAAIVRLFHHCFKLPCLSNCRPGVNFINDAQAAFACADPESAKKTDNLTVFFTLSGMRALKLLVECWWNWHLQIF
jgi:hypothetical protein